MDHTFFVAILFRQHPKSILDSDLRQFCVLPETEQFQKVVKRDLFILRFTLAEVVGDLLAQGLIRLKADHLEEFNELLLRHFRHWQCPVVGLKEKHLLEILEFPFTASRKGLLFFRNLFLDHFFNY